MKIFRIHFDKLGFQDFYEISGETIDECLKENKKQMKRRKLDAKLNNCWSEEIK